MSDSRGVYSDKRSSQREWVLLTVGYMISYCNTLYIQWDFSRQWTGIMKDLCTLFWSVIRYSWLIIFLPLCFSFPFHFLPAETCRDLVWNAFFLPGHACTACTSRKIMTKWKALWNVYDNNSTGTSCTAVVILCIFSLPPLPIHGNRKPKHFLSSLRTCNSSF